MGTPALTVSKFGLAGRPMQPKDGGQPVAALVTNIARARRQQRRGLIGIGAGSASSPASSSAWPVPITTEQQRHSHQARTAAGLPGEDARGAERSAAGASSAVAGVGGVEPGQASAATRVARRIRLHTPPELARVNAIAIGERPRSRRRGT
jgi:hypothetical protein